MKKGCIVFLSILFVFCTAAIASAFTYSATWSGDIASNGTNPEKWFLLGLPTDYNSDYVTKFDITLTYKTTYSDTIEVFLDFDSNHGSFYNSPNWIKRITPIYDGVFHDYAFSILDLGLEGLFDTKSNFYIGYGCHFTHSHTEVEILQNPVPEPASMLLLGSGLVGLAGLRRKWGKN